MPEGGDGIQVSCSTGWIDAEEDPDGDRGGHGQEDGPEGDPGRERGNQEGQELRPSNARGDPSRPTD